MIRFIFLGLFLTMTLFSFGQGSDKRPEMQRELDAIGQEMETMFDELKQALGEARFYLENEIDLEKLDEKGTMRIMGDTFDISIMGDFMTEGFEHLPESMRPDAEMLEGMREGMQQLPDLLLQSKDMFNMEELNEIMGELFGDFEIIPIEPKRDENGNAIPQTPKQPTKTTKKPKTFKI